MATQASMMLRRCASQLMQSSTASNVLIPSASFHSSHTRLVNKNEKGMFTCTLIPGDGVRAQVINENISDCFWKFLYIMYLYTRIVEFSFL